MLKRLGSLLLALLLALSLTACGETGEELLGIALDVALDQLEDGGGTEQDLTADGQNLPPAVPSGGGTGKTPPTGETPDSPPSDTQEVLLPEDGVYTSKEDVALYLHLYGRLPDNFITKKEARAMGWPGGSLEPYAPGLCIGGDYFGNYEGLLPEADGREYTECDIDTLGEDSRGAKRIVFSNDGLIYYTGDHYESFELLYGEG